MSSDEVTDVIDPRPARRLDVPFQGFVVDMVSDEVDLGEAGGIVRREYVDHPGAVVVVALNDDGDVLLLRQYRHPVGAFLWEAPAGLLDLLPTPGGSNEAVRVYLARDLTPVPDDELHTREAEEADMVVVPVPLEEAAALALAGKLHNAATIAGVLAAAIGRASDWETLRPVDSPWEYRKN